MTPRRLLLAFGVASSLLGVTVVLVPGVARAVGLPGTATTGLLVLLGLVAVTLAVGNVFGRSDSDAASVDSGLPRPEDRPQYARPGAAFDRLLDCVAWADRRPEVRRRDSADDARDAPPDDSTDDSSELAARYALRDELRSTATDVVALTENASAAADAAIRSGTWTDDPDAAGFFTDGVVPSIPLRAHLSGFRTAGTPFGRRARRAVSELASRLAPAGAESSRGTVRDGRATIAASPDEYWPSPSDGSAFQHPWRVRFLAAASFAAGGVGVLVRRPAILLTAVFGVAFVAYARAATPPRVDLAVTRDVSDPEPRPGDDVTVTVTVENLGGTVLPDLRLVDGVPPGLEVTDGSPRFATALRSGRTASFSYVVTAVHGAHTFRSPVAVVRGFSGVSERRAEVAVTGDPTAVVCRPEPPTPVDVELRRQTTLLPGRAAGIEGGGVEFHSVREYRHGDPVSRVDWKRKARTGDLTTVEFLEPHRTQTVVVVDARPEAYVASDADRAPVAQSSVEAAHVLVERLLAAGLPVGVAAVSPRQCWLSPGTGNAHRDRARDLLTTNPAFSWAAPGDRVDADDAVTELTQRLDRNTQVVLLSPMCDDDAVRVARTLDAFGHRVTVVSPNPTALGDARTEYAYVTRHLRLADLRSHDVPVIDWDPDDPFEEVMVRANLA